MVHRPGRNTRRRGRRRRAGAARPGAGRGLEPGHPEPLLSADPLPPPPLSAADTLRALADAKPGEDITVDEILSALGNHAFGLLVLVLALPNAIPGPIIPGFSVPFAVALHG